MVRLSLHLILIGLLTLALPQIRIQKVPSLKEQISYGKELFTRTAYYLGPQGSVASHTKTRMNCQSCHLQGGNQYFAMHLGHTFNSYPQYRSREGRVLTLEDRINNCIERPMNGTAIPLNGREMKAFLAYFKSLTNPTAPKETLISLPYMDRAADPLAGKKIFLNQCARCHGLNGEGKLTEDKVSFLYPPLWGPESFNAGSSMHRISKTAAFIKANMPFGTTYLNPVLTDAEAWDVSAFINDESVHTRPAVNMQNDFPNIREKPIDHPYGPFFDPFSERQHRFGPFKPIIAWLAVG